MAAASGAAAGDRVADRQAEAPASLEVELGGATRALEWPRGAKLLDTMLDAGVDAPYGCRLGQCGACMATLVEGRVRMAERRALTDDDIDAGYILCCQSTPESDRVRIRY
jgi:3-ketosteroid 9alpha-monooxygenase subunit B